MGCTIIKTDTKRVKNNLSSTDYNFVKEHYYANQNNLPNRIRDLFEQFLIDSVIQKTTADLKFIKITELNLKSLQVILPHCTKLRKLDLWKSHLGNQGAITIFSLFEYFPHLTFLCVADNHIGYEGIKILTGNFHYLQELENFQLHFNPFTPESTKLLAKKLKLLVNLKILYLDECEMGGDSLGKLIIAISHVKHIERVSMDYNYIGKTNCDLIVELLYNMKSLKRFSLLNCQINQETIEVLRVKYPGILFSFI